MVICTAAGSTYENGYIYGSRSEDKMAVYTAARPTFENEYIHGNRVQSLHDYIHGLKMNIYTTAVFNVTWLYGQRYINITRNEIGPKSGQKDCRKF